MNQEILTIGDAQLIKNPREMMTDRGVGQMQAGRDFFIRQSFKDELDDVTLPFSQARVGTLIWLAGRPNRADRFLAYSHPRRLKFR